MLRIGHATKWMATVIGKPNAGKGTLFAALNEGFNGFYEVSLGNICRDQKDQKTELWSAADEHMRVNNTTLWPTETMSAAIIQHLEGKERVDNLFFDGVPRRDDQVEMACELAHRFGFDGIRIFRVETTDAECVKRAQIRQRPDDAHISKRLQEYHEVTLPAITALVTCGAIHVDIVTLDSTNMMERAPHYAQVIATLQGLEQKIPTGGFIRE